MKWVNGSVHSKLLISVLFSNRDDAKAIYEKAKVNFILSRTEEALQCLKLAFELDPSIQEEFTKDYPEIKSSKLFKKLLGEN